jgi:tRNA dimethylallyltransferase
MTSRESIPDATNVQQQAADSREFDATCATDLAQKREIERQSALNCWYLTGATASGKSAVSLKLAEKIGAEIISLDSMAVYRGMDIGTAKPSAEHQALVPHHLIDILNPNETFSVSQYRDAALQKIQDITERDRSVLFVGGTALYLKALLRGLFDGPPADWEFRKQVESELAGCDEAELHRRLESVDPVSAHKLHINDRRRIVRALEVYYQTGIPISHWQMEFEKSTAPDACRVFTLRHPRATLHERIEQRVHTMFERGLIDEVEGLLKQWNELSHTASQAVGYREVIEHLAGRFDRQETIEKVLTRTRRFARHQETWFRGLTECRILDIDQACDADRIAYQLLEMGQ